MIIKAKTLTLLFVPAVALLACAPASFRVMQIPERSADLYPLSETSSGVTVAVDEIDSPARSKKFFGVDLTEHGILPVNVIVSNRGDHKIEVRPSDVVLLRGNSVIDPVPADVVSDIIKREYGLYGFSSGQEVEQFVQELTLNRAILMPDDHRQGVVFFTVTQPRTDRERVLTVMTLFREGGLSARLAVTDLETKERLHFGPFSLSYMPRMHTSDRFGALSGSRLSDPRMSRF